MNFLKKNPFYNQTLKSLLMLAGFASVISGTLLISGCATQTPVAEEPKEEIIEIAWPPPPQEAVIKYVDSVTKVWETKAKEKSRFADILAGTKEDKTRVLLLQKPWGVSGDPKGRLIVTDLTLGGLFVYNMETGKGEQWGQGGPGKLIKPMGVTSDKDSQVYVADIYTKQIVIFDEQGQFLKLIGGESIFSNPVDVAVNDKLGRIYVADSKKHQVLVFDMQGDKLFEIGEIGAGRGNLYYPSALAVGPDGHVYVTDTMNFRIQIFDADGQASLDPLEKWDRTGAIHQTQGVGPRCGWAHLCCGRSICQHSNF